MTDAVPAPAGEGSLEQQMEQWRRTSGIATDALRRSYPHELGIRYGSASRQAFDLYLPNVEAVGPVLVFLHGGAFRYGDHSSPGYHARPYLEAGGIFVSMGYRLAPEVQFPDCAEDVEVGLSFLAQSITKHHGDPGRIFLSGHSAGAVLAAQVGLHPGDAMAHDLVRGLVLISGFYDFTWPPEGFVNRNSDRYVSDLFEGSDRLPDHTITVAGDRDLPNIRDDAPRLAEALRRRGGSTEYFLEPDADHFEAVRSFVTPGGVVAEATKNMMGLQSGSPATAR